MESSQLRGQELICQLIFSYYSTMALKCAVELRIADIIHSHGKPITISQIASDIQSNSNSKSPINIDNLFRIMRILVRKGVFIEHHDDDHGDSTISLYGLCDSSRCLLWDFDSSLVPFILLNTHPQMMASSHNFGKRVIGNKGSTFENDQDIWSFSSNNPIFNKLFNDAMISGNHMVLRHVLSTYKDSFNCIKGTMVDVGGGVGQVISEIVKSHRHIKGINFDLPHVIATAPTYDGVTHWIIHGWNDDACVKILKNCRKAIGGKKNGKIIIVDMVLDPNSNEIFQETRLAMDLVMLANSNNGKERTELEWKKLLNEAGFSRHEQILEMIFGYYNSMALKCAIELRIADIIHFHGRPISISQIAFDIQSSNPNSISTPNIDYLSRIMRILVQKDVFIKHHDVQDESISLYGLSHSLRWLLWNSNISVVPMLLLHNNPITMATSHYFANCVKEGGDVAPFKKAHGCNLWEFASKNQEFNKLFNDAMDSAAHVTLGTVFRLMRTVLGINFDLPHVVATAPKIDGVTHIGGDMFELIPSANVVFMKSDEECVKIFKNCRKVIAGKKNGKMIIVDIVLDSNPKNKNNLFERNRSVLDLVMMALTPGGKE
ncbi:hypothetical protein F8388_000432 [Cannabis sativa]|uniref:Caffeic acid O-methyltransferase n=1 Tax=Cannabis sativa TaxID=3483 RepID=A0A7J6EZ95_CANSA|nr:hypothetical protein F8388_000432 [Cannabis sativa]